ncbi:uncharacterized protein LOC121999216 [Zingiber officinale]|uniref:uncharacterized protein LOC121999216 n=1 Tax=Zingiber officinale TaxID=94328 RepID=UPI001C4BE62A|nr:uncharacterized protein LOC121999216 [Zingiber officinale]
MKHSLFTYSLLPHTIVAGTPPLLIELHLQSTGEFIYHSTSGRSILSISPICIPSPSSIPASSSYRRERCPMLTPPPPEHQGKGFSPSSHRPSRISFLFSSSFHDKPSSFQQQLHHISSISALRSMSSWAFPASYSIWTAIFFIHLRSSSLLFFAKFAAIPFTTRQLHMHFTEIGIMQDTKRKCCISHNNQEQMLHSKPSFNLLTALAATISATRSWCVSKPGMTTEKLVANINYACGSGLADCKAIQEDGPCYSTDVIKIASYAMNAYYYGAGHREINCYFDGSALIVQRDPSYDDCIYP